MIFNEFCKDSHPPQTHRRDGRDAKNHWKTNDFFVNSTKNHWKINEFQLTMQRFPPASDPQTGRGRCKKSLKNRWFFFGIQQRIHEKPMNFNELCKDVHPPQTHRGRGRCQKSLKSKWFWMSSTKIIEKLMVFNESIKKINKKSWIFNEFSNKSLKSKWFLMNSKKIFKKKNQWFLMHSASLPTTHQPTGRGDSAKKSWKNQWFFMNSGIARVIGGGAMPKII